MNCPHCDRPITLKKLPRPGLHSLTCSVCSHPVQIQVPQQRTESWRVVRHAEKSLVGSPSGSDQSPGDDHDSAVVEIFSRESFSHGASVSDNTGQHCVETPAPESVPRNVSLPTMARPLQPETHCRRADSIPGQDKDAEKHPAGLPTNLPGYQIARAIGTGGMGTVYLGRQLSLDRPVAIKVMSRRWSNDPVFVARFTREAFAAALLNHPNVVQIFDIGDTDGTKFFSMEYVQGRSLSDLVKQEGKLDSEMAVGYVLQAARGLKQAHDRGMIHRDVKPDNLLLDDQGIVKVADLGLVKTPQMPANADELDYDVCGPKSGLLNTPMDMTGARMALGTPAYMAPEQCRDAATVDHRADIYSLGCTLYVLVTGRQPFDGQTAVELMTKHAYEPLVPPEAIVSRLPKELSAVIQKMMAKQPEDRYQTMSEVIRTLEQWLGIQPAGNFCPREEQITQLEQSVHTFTQSPAGQFRTHIVTGFVSICLLGAVLLTFFGQLTWAFGLAGMIVQAALAYFVLHGEAQKTYLFRRVRQFVVGLTLWDWGLVFSGIGLFLLLLWMLGLFWVWLGFGLAALVLAMGTRYALDRGVQDERREPLQQTERLLRRMRLSGVDEEELRGFVARYSGRHWEEFFEALFGYEAKIQARLLLLRGGSAGYRERFAVWREPIIALIDRVERARQDTRDRLFLEQVEQARLLATGECEPNAMARAAQAAEALVQQASFVRGDHTSPPLGARPAIPTMPRLSSFPRVAQTPSFLPVPNRGNGLVPKLANLVFGPLLRAALAGLLMAACLGWVIQNRNSLLSPSTAVSSLQPLVLEGIPATYTSWIDSASVGWAGILLFASLLFRGHQMGFLVLLGAAITVLGHRYGIRPVEPLRDYHVSLLLGSILTLIGFRMAQPR